MTRRPSATRSARELSVQLGTRGPSLSAAAAAAAGGASLRFQEWSHRSGLLSFFLHLCPCMFHHGSVLRYSTFPPPRDDAVRGSSAAVDTFCQWFFFSIPCKRKQLSPLANLLDGADRYLSRPSFLSFNLPLVSIDSAIVYQECKCSCLPPILIDVTVTGFTEMILSVYLELINRTVYIPTYVSID